MSARSRFLNPLSFLFVCTSALALSHSACGGEEPECEADAECGEGMRCVPDTQVCEVAPECSTNSDCEGAEQCFPGEGETGALCRLPDTCTESDDANAYCRQKQGAMGEEMYSCNTQNDTCVLESQPCPSDAACVDPDQPGLRCLPSDDSEDAKAICRLPADCSEAADALVFCQAAAGDEENYVCEPSEIDPERFICKGFEESMVAGGYIYIQDTTSTDCDLADDPNGFDPGSDISFVELQGFDGQTIGWGKTVSYMPGETQNDFKESTVLDGMEPDLLTEANEAENVYQEDVDNRCPAGDSAGRFSSTSVLTLGCGGGVIVNFPNGSDLWPIMTGHRIVVGEYAPVCNRNTGGNTKSSDTYEIYLCPEFEGGNAPTDIDCLMRGVKLSSGAESGLAEVVVD